MKSVTLWSISPPGWRTWSPVRFSRNLHAIRHAFAVVHNPDVDHSNIDDRLGRPAALRIRFRRAARNFGSRHAAKDA